VTGMRAAILRGPETLVVEHVPVPQPGAAQVLVRMHYCGICGTDLHIYRSPLTPPGCIMGHEWVGTVVECGSAVQRWSVGDRVWLGGGYIPGWRWKMEYVWDAALWAEEDFVKDLGGFAEYGAFHERSVAAVPVSVTDIEACMADPAAAAITGIRVSGLQLGQSALITGAGAIGLWSLCCAQLAGASRTCVTEVVEGRAHRARQMGADLVVDPREPDAARQIADFFDGVGADVVLECSGSQGGIQTAIDLVRPDGRIALVGLSSHPLSVETRKVYAKGLELRGVLHNDLQAGMDLVSKHQVDCSQFVTDTVSLDQIQGAFQEMLHPTDQVKTLVRF